MSLEARLAFPLTAPLITTVKNNQNQVELLWDKVSDAGIKEITLLRGDHPGKLTPLTKLPPGATSYVDKTAPPASPRYYALQVSDGARQRTQSRTGGPRLQRNAAGRAQSPQGGGKRQRHHPELERQSRKRRGRLQRLPRRDRGERQGPGGACSTASRSKTPASRTTFRRVCRASSSTPSRPINTSGVEGEASAAASPSSPTKRRRPRRC